MSPPSFGWLTGPSHQPEPVTLSHATSTWSLPFDLETLVESLESRVLSLGMKQSRIRFKQTMSLMLMQNSWKIIMQIQNEKKIIFSMPMATI